MRQLLRVTATTLQLELKLEDEEERDGLAQAAGEAAAECPWSLVPRRTTSPTEGRVWELAGVAEEAGDGRVKEEWTALLRSAFLQPPAAAGTATASGRDEREEVARMCLAGRLSAGTSVSAAKWRCLASRMWHEGQVQQQQPA